MEQWKAIPGYEGIYEVSDFGGVRSIPRVVLCRMADKIIARKRKGKVLAPLVFSGTGYLGFQLSVGGKVKFALAHRLVATTFHGQPPQGMVCAHLDGSKTNNSASNLAWVSHAENQSHRIIHGTSNRGARAYQSKLTEADVRAALVARGCGETYREIAARYGVHISTIQHAINGKNWAYLRA